MQVPLLLVVPFHLFFHLSFVAKVSSACAHLQSQDLLPDQKLVEFFENSSEGDSGSPSAASQTSVATDQLDGQSEQHISYLILIVEFDFLSFEIKRGGVGGQV